MWIVKNGARTHPCDQFYDRLVLEPEMDKNRAHLGFLSILCDQFYDRLVLQPEMGSNLIWASTLVT